MMKDWISNTGTLMTISILTYRDDTFLFYSVFPSVSLFDFICTHFFRNKEETIHSIIKHGKLLHKQSIPVLQWHKCFKRMQWVPVILCYAFGFTSSNRKQDLKVLNDTLAFLTVFSWSSFLTHLTFRLCLKMTKLMTRVVFYCFPISWIFNSIVQIMIALSKITIREFNPI